MLVPRLIFLAGPNGAGKSTFYEAYLGKLGLPFVNADRLTAALGISNQEAASAADLAREELLAARISFITETVFSDPVGAKLNFLRKAVDAGFDVHLIFIGIATATLSEGRVKQRVRRGGHDVPTERLERRFQQSIKNLHSALAFVPSVSVYENSSAERPFQLVLSIRGGQRAYVAELLPQWLHR
jgi:predicted ABC-type ATPase